MLMMLAARGPVETQMLMMLAAGGLVGTQRSADAHDAGRPWAG